MALIGLRYDLRVPTWGSVTASEQYRACMDQVRWGDELGLDMVVLSEHHGAEDGFMPAPFTMAAAVAGASRKIGINISAALVPLHDPVRLAEQMLTVDLVSQGRMTVILGTGYRDEEFDMAGISFADRMPLLIEAIDVFRKAFTGEPFDYRGRTVVVTPKPHTPGGPFLMMGGSSEKAVRRAAQLRLGFAAASNDQQLADWYKDECAKVGFEHGFISIPQPLGFVHVTHDPERDWARIMPHAMHEARVYGSWQRKGQYSSVTVKDLTDEQSLKDSGVYRVITPAECVELHKDLGPFGAVVLHPLMGGLPADLGWESLELFASDVLPLIRPAS